MVSDTQGSPFTALVVFADRPDAPKLRLLKPAYRHCFAVIRHDHLWLACDSLKNRIELYPLDLPHEFDLPGFYAQQGHQVLIGHRGTIPPAARLVPSLLTCVGVVKRLLWLHAPTVWTPWQLFCHLTRSPHHFKHIDRGGALNWDAKTAIRSCA